MKPSVLITGASGGIGRAVAKEISGSYSKMFLHYYSKKNETEILADELSNSGISCKAVYADLSAEGGAEQLLSQTGTKLSSVVLISGSTHYGLLQDMSQNELQKVITLNLTAPIEIVKSVIPHMISQRNGAIVAVTSIWGESGASCESVYSAAKGGMNTFIKAIAKELGPNGIRANAVAPGAVDTGMLQDFTEDEIKDLIDQIPSGRLARPEEIAGAVNFLLGSGSSYINGHILSVNGAWRT
ncbi:elongation factor P 5-aminopentanone reductase [Fictibacillus aquaticus]|uniref:elongation factor P 5-aminopentanone reductase n=1 Tax=Fictibacillus aquaticus TaxID=2021314 RepID=UPI0013FD695B|nr:SDR family NAD(P)-dependent oxidoreductase [Fictibacillus aquaticus]